MLTVIDPQDDVPMPYDMGDEETENKLEEVVVAANTARLQEALGASLTADDVTLHKEASLLEAFVKSKTQGKKITKQNTAYAAIGFLKTYGAQLGLDVDVSRAAITNKLMEIANCGDTKYELRALELLGKHIDIGLFTNRSEVTIKHQDPDALEAEIKERVKRLLNADVIDVVPLMDSLEAELGLLDDDEEEVDEEEVDEEEVDEEEVDEEEVDEEANE